MSLLFSLPNLELKAEKSGVIEGYGSVFNGRDSHGDIVMPGAFAKSLEKGLPLMLWQHQQDAPIGRWTSAAEDSRGLFLKGQVNLKTTAGKDAYEHLLAGDVNGLSIGYTLPPGGWRPEGDSRHLHEVSLAEVSVVSLPSNADARVTAVKTYTIKKPSTLREFEHALVDIGYSRREAQAIARKGYAHQHDESEELSAALLRINAAALNF